MLTRRLFEETGGFDEAMPACEDYDLWLRITPNHQVRLIDKKLLTRYGGHEDQLSERFPAMDRFRIYSLLKIYGLGILNDTQKNPGEGDHPPKAKRPGIRRKKTQSIV